MAPIPISTDRIKNAVVDAHQKQKNRRGGKNASYIPILAEVDSKLFGVCVATVDLKVFAAGDAKDQFALESVSKMFTLALVMEQRGPREVRRKVGANPTGQAFNSVLALELHNDKPMSPLVNSGAISTTSLVDATDGGPLAAILEAQSDFARRRISITLTAKKSMLPSKPRTFITGQSPGYCAMADTSTATRWKGATSIPDSVRRWTWRSWGRRWPAAGPIRSPASCHPG